MLSRWIRTDGEPGRGSGVGSLLFVAGTRAKIIARRPLIQAWSHLQNTAEKPDEKPVIPRLLGFDNE